MSEPIKEGDLVVVILPTPCGCSGGVGFVYRVTKIGNSLPGGTSCIHCGHMESMRVLAFREDGAGAELYRLKRIPPLGELEGEKRDEEITA